MTRNRLASVSLIALIALSACSGEKSADTAFEQAEPGSRLPGPAPTMDSASEARAPGAPDISPTAAPGVAFDYRYAFRVSDAKIAAVQEAHAAACETLGIARCRISGMQYRLVREDRVQASLAFKLDPVIARKFGRDAISSVERAKGILVESEISGTDVGSTISVSQRRSAGLGADLARMEARLSAGGMSDRERAELQAQAATLRQQIDAEVQTRGDGEASLATTLMSFTYWGGDGVPGLADGNPFELAAERSAGSFVVVASVLMTVVGVMLPWLILLALLVLLARSPAGRRVRGWFRGQNVAG